MTDHAVRLLRWIHRRYDWRFVWTVNALLLVALFAVVVRIRLLPHVTDDAYITFRYADRWAAGRGLTFNDGERVEGFSNPLWLFLIAAGRRATGVASVRVAQSLGFASFLGLFGALRWLAGAFPPRRRDELFWFAAAWLVLTPGIEVFATLGLEGPLLGFLLLLAVAGTVRDEGRGWPLALAAGCLGLVGITRPEGPLYGALWFLVLAVGRVRRGAVLAGIGVVVASPAAVYEAFRVATYASWVPNTAIAKPPGVYAGSPWFDLWGPWVSAVAPVALVWLLAAGIGERRPPSVALRRMVAAAGGPVLAGVVFNLYAGPDWMLFGRFVTPLWPLVVVVVAAGLLERISEEAPRLVLGLAVLASALTWQGAVRDYLLDRGLQPMLMRGADQVAVGEWLCEQFPEPRTIAVQRLGGVAASCPQHTVWDFAGLTDVAEARFVRARFRDLPEALAESPVMARRPEIAVFASATAEPGYGPALRAALVGYVCLHRFPQGDQGTLDVWLRRDLPAPVAPGCDLQVPDR